MKKLLLLLLLLPISVFAQTPVSTAVVKTYWNQRLVPDTTKIGKTFNSYYNKVDNPGMGGSVSFNPLSINGVEKDTISTSGGDGVLIDTSGVGSIDWTGRRLVDTGGVAVLSWDTRSLVNAWDVDTLTVNNLAGNGSGLVAVDNTGKLSWSAGGGGGSVIALSAPIVIDTLKGSTIYDTIFHTGTDIKTCHVYLHSQNINGSSGDCLFQSPATYINWCSYATPANAYNINSAFCGYLSDGGRSTITIILTSVTSDYFILTITNIGHWVNFGPITAQYFITKQ